MPEACFHLQHLESVALLVWRDLVHNFCKHHPTPISKTTGDICLNLKTIFSSTIKIKIGQESLDQFLYIDFSGWEKRQIELGKILMTELKVKNSFVEHF